MDKVLWDQIEKIDLEATVLKAQHQQQKMGRERFNQLCHDPRLLELAALILKNGGGDLMDLLGVLVLAFDLGGQPIPEECLPALKLPKWLLDAWQPDYSPNDIPAEEQ